jgi:integrase/recombinase XerD
VKGHEFLHDFQMFQEKIKSSHTVLAYVSDVKQFLSFLGKNLDQADADDIERFKDYLLNKRRLKPKSINRKLVSIRQYLKYIISLSLDIKININVDEECSDIKLIKIQNQEYLDELLTMGDLERILGAAEKDGDVRAIAVINGMYLTGARVSELLQLKVYDVNKDEISIMGKGIKYRILFPPERLKKYFNDYLQVRNSDKTDLLFVNTTNGKPMDRQSVHNIIKKYAGKGKVKLSRAHAHNLRHMYGYMLNDMGLSLGEIADLLGHQNINTTRIYTRKTKSELKKAIKNL